MEQIVVRPIEIVFSIFSFAILARVLLTWVRPDPTHPAVKLLFDVTEPVLRPIRDMMPAMGMFDFSPIVAIFLIKALQALVSSLIGR